MDSPGLFDTDHSEAEVAAILMQAIAELHPGPHALLFVIPIGRYKEEDQKVYTRLKALMDDNMKNYIIVVFTHADGLTPAKTESIHDMINGGPDSLKSLMADCNNRFVLFNNNASTDDKQSQVSQLMEMVLKLKNDNHNEPYQCPKYAYISEKIDEEIKKRLEEVEKKELEKNKHFQQLEEKLNEMEENLRNREKELEKKAEELDRRQKEEITKLQERVQHLEHLLAQQAIREQQEEKITPTPQPDKEQEKRLAEWEAQVAKLQNKLITKESQLATELHDKDREISNQQTQIRHMANEKNRLEAQLMELKKNKQQDAEALQKYANMEAQLQVLRDKLRQVENDTNSREQQQETARLQREDELAATRRRLQELEEAQAWHDQARNQKEAEEHRENQNTKSRICTIL